MIYLSGGRLFMPPTGCIRNSCQEKRAGDIGIALVTM